MGAYFCDYKFNPFHFPTAAQTISLPDGFSAPLLYKILERCMWVLCPGLFLQIFTIGASDIMGWIMWTVAVLLNGPIYYSLGWVLLSISARFGFLRTGQ